MADEEVKEKVDKKPEATEEPSKGVSQEKPKEEKKDDSKKSESSDDVDEKAKDVAKDEIIPELTNEYKLPGAGENKPINHKSFKKVLIGAVIVLVLALIGAGALWMTHDDPVSESNSEIVYYQGSAVTAVEGNVEFNTGTGWNVVEQGTQLEEGHSLRTLSGSRAVITLDEGSAVRLDSDSVVTITKLTGDEVIIDNVDGQVYARVVPSETRVFTVTVSDQAYEALGTAYKTVNEDEEKGVEVYHSKVDVKEKSEVNEGETYFTLSKDESKNGKVAKLDLEKLKDDDFINWNKAKDEADDEFADKLGILKDLNEEEEKEEETPPTSSDAAIGISAAGSKGGEGINVSWSVNGVSTTDGFKVVYDKSTSTPTYGTHSAQYVAAGQYSTVLDLTNGKTYYIRVCAYRPDAGSCDSYSNTITVTAPVVEKDPVVNGAVTLSKNGDSGLAWSFEGTAPHGFKVVMNQSGNPTYPSDSIAFVSGTQYEIKPDKLGLVSGQTYKFSVCKYTDGTENDKCVDYSNEVEYTTP